MCTNGTELTGGEGGIRTHGTVKPYTGFRIRRIRPLCHLSAAGAQFNKAPHKKRASQGSSRMRMNRVDPVNLLGRFRGLDVEVDDDRVLAASNQNAGQRLAAAGVDLLVGDERGHIDEIARAGLGAELK